MHKNKYVKIFILTTNVLFCKIKPFHHFNSFVDTHQEISPNPSFPKRGIPPFRKGREGGISFPMSIQWTD